MKRVFVVCVVAIAAGMADMRAAFAENISITVKGMVCSFCAQGIKATFSRKEEVKTVQVDLDKKIVMIATHAGKTLPDAEIRQAIGDAGYDVVSIERKDDE